MPKGSQGIPCNVTHSEVNERSIHKATYATGFAVLREKSRAQTGSL